MPMDAYLHYLWIAANPMALGIVTLGVALGIVIGALPGLTATMGVTLLMPLAISLDLGPHLSLAMLIGIYVGAIYGGTITAILIATPGTPASAPTVLDGFPMTQRGEAGRAIVWATLASFVGGVLGALILSFLSPQLSRFALRFSYHEYFALAVFGLSMIVTISGRDVLKGIISGLAGLLLATVGLDPVAGIPRFCFGFPELFSGIGFIPVLIGLFAFAQVFSEIPELSRKGFTLPHLRFSYPSVKEFFRYRFTFLWPGTLGTFIGSLPGAGCDIASFVSYNEAKRLAKPGDRFGDGEPKGIIASESGKSGCTGGAMIPMLTLGVPGDAVTAVMLNALVVQGLQPGPLLFRDHADVVYPIFLTMILANFIMLVLGLLSARYTSRMILIDKRVLLPVICVLSVIGAYSLQNSLFDVGVAVAMGLIGYGMKRWEYPASPVVLALILGPMAEQNLRRAMLMPGASPFDFFTRPLSALLLLIAAATVVTGLWKHPGWKREEG
ncbi:MAG TPA: tripartite tricarboxylate transporter permease [bacterium]|nr:tripartite tricarboxylate transporter permease [bacterium]